MDRRSEEFETDSTIDNTIDQMDTSDPEIHFRAQVRGIDAGKLLAGNFGPVAVGPRTDADTRQAAAPTLLVTSVLLSRPEAAVQLPHPAQLL